MKVLTLLALLLCLLGCVAAAGADRTEPTQAKPSQAKPSLILALSLQERRATLWGSPVPFPEGMTLYRPAVHTQSIVVVNDRDSIKRFPIRRLLRKWQFSGGLMDVQGWRSDKFRYLPSPPYSWVGNIQVKNSLGYYQPNRGIKRDYPNGTRFDDVLYNDAGEVFEHRSRSKEDGKWTSEVLYKDVAARPQGYEGLKVSCASCHSEAGSGEYGLGLVPGSDTVLSDPLAWELIGERD